jgi:hypothetical protein
MAMLPSRAVGIQAQQLHPVHGDDPQPTVRQPAEAQRLLVDPDPGAQCTLVVNSRGIAAPSSASAAATGAVPGIRYVDR